MKEVSLSHAYSVSKPFKQSMFKKEIMEKACYKKLCMDVKIFSTKTGLPFNSFFHELFEGLFQNTVKTEKSSHILGDFRCHRHACWIWISIKKPKLRKGNFWTKLCFSELSIRLFQFLDFYVLSNISWKVLIFSCLIDPKLILDARKL